MKNSPNNLDGWAGFGNESVDIINKNISVVQSPVDCPIAKAYFDQDGFLEETLTFELTPSIHFLELAARQNCLNFLEIPQYMDY